MFRILVLALATTSMAGERSAPMKPIFYLGTKVSVGQTWLTHLLPKFIAYRNASPQFVEVAQEIPVKNKIKIEGSANWGKGRWHGPPLFCIDCDLDVPFSSVVVTTNFGVKIGWNHSKIFENIWVGVSRENLQYRLTLKRTPQDPAYWTDWQDGTFESIIYYLGVEPESFFIRSSWVLFGLSFSLKIPIVMDNKATPNPTEGLDEQRFFPLFDFKVKIKV